MSHSMEKEIQGLEQTIAKLLKERREVGCAFQTRELEWKELCQHYDTLKARIKEFEGAARALVEELMSDDFSDEAMSRGAKLALELAKLLKESGE